jgi:hypothetical protein
MAEHLAGGDPELIIEERLFEINFAQADCVVTVNITEAGNISEGLMGQAGAVQFQNAEINFCAVTNR